MILQSKDIKKFRIKKLQEQKGIDPITLEEITNSQMDHSHQQGFLRQALTRESNMLIGKIENYYYRYIAYKQLPITLPDILLNISRYLRADYSTNPLHSTFISIKIKRFSRLNLKKQKKILKELKVESCKNKSQNTKVYRKALMDPKNIYKI